MEQSGTGAIERRCNRRRRRFQKNRGQTSLSAYEALLVELTSLEASVPSVIENYEQEAGAVMVAGNYTRAQEVYRTLSLLVPDNPSYLDSLERAEQLPDVTLILSEVDQIIVDGELDDARNRLKDAIALVPDWPASLDTQSRIETAIGRRNFQSTMTQGFAALAAGEFESARALFKRQRLHPLTMATLKKAFGKLQAGKPIRSWIG